MSLPRTISLALGLALAGGAALSQSDPARPPAPSKSPSSGSGVFGTDWAKPGQSVETPYRDPSTIDLRRNGCVQVREENGRIRCR